MSGATGHLLVVPLVLLLSACTGLIGPEAPSPTTAQGPTVNVIVVSGIFDPSGDRLVELQPPQRHLRPAGPLPVPSPGRYVIQVTYESGDPILISFDALVADDRGRTQHGFFEVLVPEDRSVRNITIEDTMTGRTLATIDGAQIVP